LGIGGWSVNEGEDLEHSEGPGEEEPDDIHDRKRHSSHGDLYSTAEALHTEQRNANQTLDI
jgi:hypothetical protein